jgi:hypothetical protein
MGYYDGEMMHEVTNFPVEPEPYLLMFLMSRFLLYFDTFGFVFLFVSIYHFLSPPFLSPLLFLLPIFFPLARQDRKSSSTLYLPSLSSLHFYLFAGYLTPRTVLIRKSKCTVAYRSRSGFSSDRISRWEVEMVEYCTKSRFGLLQKT